MTKQTYIPTTAEVRDAYAWEREGWGGAAFDRWLADHDAEVWDEGAKKGWALYNEQERHVLSLNPYRGE